MTRSVRIPVACAAILPLAAMPAFAQDGMKLSVNGSLRARAETIGGQFRPNTPEHDSFLSFRSVLAAKAEIGGFTLAGELVDARGYGESAGSSVRTNEINDLEPVQAYLAWRPAKGMQLTMGKFAMDIGASRLVGRTDFPNGVPTYLGARLEMQDARRNQLFLFWTRPFTALPDTPADIYDNKVQLDRATENIEFFGGNATLASLFGKSALEAYAFRLIEHDRATHPTRNRRLVTFGMRLRRAPATHALDYEVETALQRGLALVRAAGAGDDRDAFDKPRQLDRRGTDPRARAQHQDGVALAQLRPPVQRRIGRSVGNRHGERLQRIEPGGDGVHGGAMHHDLLAVSPPVADEGHQVPRPDVADVAAAGKHPAHAFRAGHEGKRRGLLIAALDQQPGGVAHRGVVHFDQHFVHAVERHSFAFYFLCFSRFFTLVSVVQTKYHFL